MSIPITPVKWFSRTECSFARIATRFACSGCAATNPARSACTNAVQFTLPFTCTETRARTSKTSASVCRAGTHFAEFASTIFTWGPGECTIALATDHMTELGLPTVMCAKLRIRLRGLHRSASVPQPHAHQAVLTHFYARQQRGGRGGRETRPGFS